VPNDSPLPEVTINAKSIMAGRAPLRPFGMMSPSASRFSVAYIITEQSSEQGKKLVKVKSAFYFVLRPNARTISAHNKEDADRVAAEIKPVEVGLSAARATTMA
jgi:hypothetical protein